MPKTKATAKEFLKKLDILNEDESPAQDYLNSPSKGDEFYYAVGFRTYCQQQLDNKNPKRKYRIYNVEEIPITKSK